MWTGGVVFSRQLPCYMNGIPCGAKDIRPAWTTLALVTNHFDNCWDFPRFLWKLCCVALRGNYTSWIGSAIVPSRGHLDSRWKMVGDTHAPSHMSSHQSQRLFPIGRTPEPLDELKKESQEIRNRFRFEHTISIIYEWVSISLPNAILVAFIFLKIIYSETTAFCRFAFK